MVISSARQFSNLFFSNKILAIILNLIFLNLKMDYDLIIVDENDNILGFKSKYESHLNSNIDDGLIHRAFSVLIFNENNELLLTERSHDKTNFPAYVTNACCSHPLKKDYVDDLNDINCFKKRIIKRLKYELGIENLNFRELIYITKFLYKCRFDEKFGEQEIDYLFVLKKDIILNPNPREVKTYYYKKEKEIFVYLGMFCVFYNFNFFFKFRFNEKSRKKDWILV